DTVGCVGVRSRARCIACLLLVAACGGSSKEGSEHALVVDPGDEGSSEPDSRREDRDSDMKKVHQKCFKKTGAKHPKLEVKSLEPPVSIRADGSVAKVDVDKSKTDVSDPSFMQCLVGRLKQ